MAANPRFEIGSGSPDSAATFGYSNSHRAHFSTGGTGGPNLERSSSSRENHESSGRVVTPGGSGSGFPSPAAASGYGDFVTMAQILSLDLISSGEQKYARQLELRSATAAAMAMVGEAQGNSLQKPLDKQGPEELKRIKLSLHENAVRARERSRGLTEAINKLEKFRNSLQMPKRPRTEGAGHERQITSSSGERSTSTTAAAGTNSNKATFCASPSHTEGSMAKADEKSKGVVPNKRMRTSMQDVRLESRTGTTTFQKSSAVGEREREPATAKSFSSTMDEKDRSIQGSGEAWERTKTKGKRSATKSDIAIGSGATGASEIERDHKWGVQHRSSTDSRPRPSEGHSFRSGPVHGVVSIHKSAVRNEADSTVSVGDKGDRFLFPEKDRAVLKSTVKLQHKDEGPLLNSAILGKAKAARAPRTSTGIPINPSSVGAHASRPHSAEAWDRTAVSAVAPTRAQIPVGPSNNRKRPTSARSSSPPVAQWVGQRSQKMPRIARRMMVASPVGPSGLGRDEAVNTVEGESTRDSTATPSGSRSNLNILPSSSVLKKVPSTTTLSQIKSKLERVPSPAGLSESDDSEGGDAKTKEKWKKHGDAEVRFGGVNQKITPLFSPGKKSRVGSKEEGGDGIRRQGRSGRGMIAVRENSTIPSHIEKGDVAANAKQMKNARPGTEKPDKPTDVKPGRPPTKKGAVGDRKGLTRLKRPGMNVGGEISGESDDDHEELMAAVHSAINASLHACSSVFWKEMEPLFAYLAHDARESLKLQVRAREWEEEEIFPGLFGSGDIIEKNSAFTNSSSAGKKPANGLEINVGTVSAAFNNLKEEQGLDAGTGGWITSKQLPLSQRLLAALIIEEDIEDESREDGRQFEFPSHTGDGSPSDSERDKEQDSESEVETRGGDSGKLNGWSKRSPYDSSYTSNGHRHWDSESELLNSPAKSKEEERHSTDNGLNKAEGTYQNLKLDDRIALELQSIGLYPEPGDLTAREDDQIAEELKKTYTILREQVHKNKERLSSLEKSISSSQEAEEREREKLAMRKLVENAFTKRLGTRGGLLGVSGSKSAASKAGRAAALVVAKRCLTRWKHYMESGESCFSEPRLRDILLCVSSKEREIKASSNNAESRASVNSVGLSLIGSLELKLAASGGVRWICSASGVCKPEKDSIEPVTPSEQYGEREEMWSNRSKEREVSLEDVVGSGGGAPCGTKGKRSERERDGNGMKGRPGLSVSVSVGGAVKGERKTKTKPRQKTGPLLKAVNGLLGKQTEPTSSGRLKPEPSSSAGPGPEPRKEGGEATLDLSHLQIPSMEELGAQGQDLGSWLDFDDPSLPDAGGDFVGLDVPPDDLADLAMMM